MKESRGPDRGDRSTANTFAEFALERASRQRRDEEWVKGKLGDPTTRFVPIWDSKVLIRDKSGPCPLLLGPKDAADLVGEAESVVLLGETAEHTYFAVSVSDPDASLPPLARDGEFRSLRAVGALLDQQAAGLLAYAKAMIHWDQHHQFCGNCGSPTTSTHGGHLRVCTNELCGEHHFPRTDPAIIVRVTNDNRCLLGRQPTWPEGFYSIIAGFVEPGESLEAAVAREIREETGIRVTDIRYHSSQPWPFPSSLMVGFTAQATSTVIRLHDGELEDARWLSREEVASELREGSLRLPSDISISHRLIKDWFDSGELGDLRGVTRPR